MPKRVSDWLRRRITGPIALAGVAVFLVFGATVLPAQARKAEATSAGVGAPDLSLFYTPAELEAMAGAYGEEGRLEFIRARWTFDLAFPAVYGFFYLTSVAWLFARAFPAGSRWQLANLAPIGAVTLDLLENTATSLVMVAFPEPSPIASALAPWFTLSKWIFVGVSSLLLVLGVAAAAARRSRGGSTSTG